LSKNTSKKFENILSVFESSSIINLTIQVVEENTRNNVDVKFVGVVQLMPRIAFERDNNLVGLSSGE